MDELDKILGDQGKETPSKETPVKKEDPENKDPEVLTKEQQLANVNKAIEEANRTLKEKRKQIKEGDDGDDPEKDEPKIDLSDPNSKAWDKHIKDAVAPVNSEIEAEKQEIFKFAFRDFVAARPGLAANSELMRKVIATYDRVKENTGRVREGVINDLRRAYAAENFENIDSERHQARVDKSRKEAIYADAGVSRGASNYHQEREAEPVYDDQDAAILARWNMTPQSHAQLVKELEDKKKTEGQ